MLPNQLGALLFGSVISVLVCSTRGIDDVPSGRIRKACASLGAAPATGVTRSIVTAHSPLRLRGGCNYYQGVDLKPVVFEKKKPSAGPKVKRASAEDDNSAPPPVPHEVKMAIMKARQAKGISQKDLAKALNIQAQEIQLIESGRNAPNNALLARMDRVLGTKLPRIKKTKPSAEG